MIENNNKVGIAPVVFLLAGHLSFLFAYEIFLFNIKDTTTYELIMRKVSPLVDFLSQWIPALDLYYRAFHEFEKGHWAVFSQNIYVISLLATLITVIFIYRYRKNMALSLLLKKKRERSALYHFTVIFLASVFSLALFCFGIFVGKAKHADNVIEYIMFNNLYFSGVVGTFILLLASFYGVRNKLK